MSSIFELEGSIKLNYDKVVDGLNKVQKESNDTAEKFDKLANKSDKTKKSLDNAGDGAEKNGSKFATFKSRIGGAVSAIGGFISSTAIVGFFKECTQGAINATTANAKMTEVMKSASKATDSQIDSLKQYAVELSKTGVISAGLNKTAMTQLSTFGLTTDSIKTLIPQLDNLAVNQKGVNATSEDMMNYANMIGKAMQGTATAMTRVGVTMTDAQKKIIENGTEQQRASVIAEVLKQNYGNLNEEIAKTPEGKSKQLQNNLASLKVTLGQNLLPIVVKITSALSKLLSWFNNLSDGTKKFIGNLTIVLGTTALVTSAITSIIGTLKALGVSIKAIEILTKASPFVIVITAVITALVLLWNKCEGFRNAVHTILNGIKIAFNATCSFLKSVFGGVFNFFKTTVNVFVVFFKFAWEIIKTAFNVVATVLKAIWSKVWAFIKAVFAPYIVYFKIQFNVIKTVFTTVVNAIKSVWNSFCNWIKPIFDKVVNNLKIAWLGVKVVFSAVVNTIKGVWNGACSSIHSKWTSLVSKIKSAWNTITEPFRNVVNKIKSIWDGIRSHFKLPHFNLKGKFSLDPPSVPKINVDWYYKGGIFKQPTILANGIGVGDAYNGKGNNAEVVAPISDLKGIIKDLLNVNITLDIDGRTLVREAVAPYQDEIIKYKRGR